jgi:hypothetical protein
MVSAEEIELAINNARRLASAKEEALEHIPDGLVDLRAVLQTQITLSRSLQRWVSQKRQQPVFAATAQKLPQLSQSLKAQLAAVEQQISFTRDVPPQEQDRLRATGGHHLKDFAMAYAAEQAISRSIESILLHSANTPNLEAYRKAKAQETAAGTVLLLSALRAA